MKHAIQLDDLVKARLGVRAGSPSLQDAIRHLLRGRPDVRLKLVTYRYQHDDISLAKAAQLAGVSWQQMREVLIEQGVPVCLGAQSQEDAKNEAATLRQHLS